jgi:hypothetical protein
VRNFEFVSAKGKGYSICSYILSWTRSEVIKVITVNMLLPYRPSFEDIYFVGEIILDFHR